MVPSEPTSRDSRSVAASHLGLQTKRASRLEHPQGQLANAVEVGKTMLILALVGIGIVALRYALVVAHGLLGYAAGR